MSLSPIVLIPARLASTRLPNKPLADIHGKPMIVHCVERALAAKIGPVAVAAADKAIADAVEAFGHKAVLTDPDHPSGSDRIMEALSVLDPDEQYNAVINVQGDLPTLDPFVVEAVLAPLTRSPDVDIATAVAEITDPAEKENPNVVKAFIGFGPEAGANPPIARALTFTRATAPTGEGPLYHHIGLYAYRREALSRFVSLPPGVLEQREKLEQLRALEAGMRIDAALVKTVPLGVDTPEDLEKARVALAGK